MGKFSGLLLASDLDGTLLGLDHTVSEKNLKAINYFVENGGTFTVASGRPPLSTKLLLEKKFCFKIPLIMVNGAIIYDFEQDKIVKSKVLTASTKDLILDVIQKFPYIGCEIFTDNDIVLASSSEVSKAHLEYVNKDVTVRKFDELPSVNTWCKVNFTYHIPEKIKAVSDYVMKKYANQYAFCYSCKEFFELTNINARKDISLFEVAGEYGFEKENIITIGDNFNDLEMISNVKYGFCPENAVEDVKKAAYKILCHHDDSAVANLIEYIDTIFN